MILGTSEILKRLKSGQVFDPPTWVEANIKEASYALRVAGDGMIIGDDIIEPGDTKNSRSEIEIQPGRIAVLSTMERLCMPPDLVGRLGVRLKFASKGLVGQMGMQVDPCYGNGEDEGSRLYIKVANLGNRNVIVEAGDPVFNIEFSEVVDAQCDDDKEDTWDRIKRTVGEQSQRDWTSITLIQHDLDEQSRMNKEDLDRRLGEIRDNQQAVVMFGVFLVAITILTVMVGVILNVRDAPSWVTHAGWIALVVFCGVAAAAIAGFLSFFGLVLWLDSRRRRLDSRRSFSENRRISKDNP